MRQGVSLEGINAGALLGGRIISASAPCRVDAGGTLDIRAMALPLETRSPVTLNIALDLRTRVFLSGYDKGLIKISSWGMEKAETWAWGSAPFNSPLGMMFAAVSHFGFHGLEIRIEAQAPLKAALGGSSTALVALVKALSNLREAAGKKPMRPGNVLHLAFQIEDAIAGGHCGAQDQAAAVYGGVNLWRWRFGAPLFVVRSRLLDAEGERQLSERMIVANSGIRHVSGAVNRGWVMGFLAGEKRDLWLEANHAVKRLALALKAGKWRQAAHAMKEEMSIRRELTPDALVPLTARLIEEAEARGCGARFAGAGAGGCVWAIGEKDAVSGLREAWEGLLEGREGASILDCRIDHDGVRLETGLSS